MKTEMTPLPTWAAHSNERIEFIINNRFPLLPKIDTNHMKWLFNRIKTLESALEIAMTAVKTYSDNDYARVPAEEARVALAEIEKLGEKE